MDIIAHYAFIAAASGRMLAAARISDWDALQELGDIGPKDAYERETRVGLLKAILSHDAEIRDLASPWMKQLNAMLSGMGQGRRMRQAYS
jgi:flagellar protein FliT